jgi:hypothetical protein
LISMLSSTRIVVALCAPNTSLATMMPLDEA